MFLFNFAAQKRLDLVTEKVKKNNIGPLITGNTKGEASEKVAKETSKQDVEEVHNNKVLMGEQRNAPTTQDTSSDLVLPAQKLSKKAAGKNAVTQPVIVVLPELPSTKKSLNKSEAWQGSVKKETDKQSTANNGLPGNFIKAQTRDSLISKNAIGTVVPPIIAPVTVALEDEIADLGPLKITFQLKFNTKFGQRLYITGNHEIFGNGDVEKAYPMNYFSHEYWYAQVEIPNRKAINHDIVYNYFIIYEDGVVSNEWGSDKIINPSCIQTNDLLLIDTWNYSGNYENTFYTEPFQQVLLKNNYAPVDRPTVINYTHTFRVKAPLLAKGEVLFIAGNVPQLNSWSVDEPLILSRKQNEDWWTIELDLSASSFPVEYKYGVYNIDEDQLIRFEQGSNRTFYGAAKPNQKTILSDGFAVLPNNTFKGAGVAIPVFSLRSNSGLGVGEFNDIKLLVDWAKNIGLKLVQILPINDTTATYTFADSYPYAAISAFALHPIYLHLPCVVDEENAELLSTLSEQQGLLNELVSVNYEQVMQTKLAFVKKLFPLQKEATFISTDFLEFFRTNKHWLVPYTAFSFFRDKYGTADYNSWPTNQVYNKEDINSIASSPLTADENLSVYYFIQYHLHCQLKAATEYAHENGIIVKGDIPIGIFRNSCDAWQEPQLYNMDKQAGAPPDDFAVKGQNWGFPTYNWQQMALDGFSWWKRRFEQMRYYFDAFRIDHILGFFRIWSIPMDAVEGILGNFVPALPVSLNEFHAKGIWFNYERFTKPFINDAVLSEIFGAEAEAVKKQFLQERGYENYELLPAFDTQRKVGAYFGGGEPYDQAQKLKQGLFDLISNVILFEVEGSQGLQFHFRIAVQDTASFRFLDDATKNNLQELYVDYFYHRQDDFWRKEAMLKLPELKSSTNMLICGEDLGMVPATVPGVMKDLGILSLEIQRMPKDPTKAFFHPNDAPYLSVVTPSTHDMSTIRGWWEEDREKTQKFYNIDLGQYGYAPFFCEPWVNRTILLQHFYSPAMWSIFQLQDLLGMDGNIRRKNPHEERINVPANPKHYWQYRMHLSLEDLNQQKDFNTQLRDFVKASGR